MSKIINNDIYNSNCSFEVGKLLKEKEFNVPITEFQWKDNNQSDRVPMPTQDVVKEWIRVNFNHDIESRGVRYAGDEKSSYYQAYVNGCVISMERYNTPSEAVEAALLYTLENLIQ